MKTNHYRLPNQLRAQCKGLGMDELEIFKYETYWLKKNRVLRTGKKSSVDSEKQKVYESEWAFQKNVTIKKFKDIREATVQTRPRPAPDLQP